MRRGDDVRCIAALLSDPHRSEHPREFPADSIVAAKPGLYSWWGDTQAQELFFQATGGISVGQLLYVGQAGANRWPSGRKSTATLKSRIRSNHIRGNLLSSTFRHTISALLHEPLNLRLARPGKLMPEENRRVSTWIEDHMRVAIVAMEDRDSLGRIERAVLDTLDPPFNLKGRPPTDLRRRLSELRRAIEKQTES